MQDTSVDLWATDEVHFQQHGSRCRMWIPPEIKDPVLLHAPTRKGGMPSPRTRRLMLDEETLQRVLQDWPLIQITGKAGIPPEIYRFTYNLRGLYVSGSGEIVERDSHLLEVNLTLGYPRRAPQCRMLTPVFHPNFDDSMVCIGDFWAASEGLDQLISHWPDDHLPGIQHLESVERSSREMGCAELSFAAN
jgi:ubiquitin-protein ligase